MAAVSVHLDLPYTPRQIYDLVADIERYPSFLAHIASARITRRDGAVLMVDQVFRFRMLRFRFTTRAVLEPPGVADGGGISPGSIVVENRDARLGSFIQSWGFADAPKGGTRLSCRTEFGTTSRLLRLAMGAVTDELMAVTMRAFHQRARQLYGDRMGPATDR
jgi:coenzyme Q-binding protein COQ10